MICCFFIQSSLVVVIGMSSSTTRLYERILFPPFSKLPPPRILHSSSFVTLDPLLLDLISLICREHILTWYSSISRDPDRAFIRQVTSIFIHVIQALEVRLAQVDLVELIVLDLPSLFEQHVNDFDQSIERANSVHAHNLNSDSVFHSLQPHIAISISPSTSTSEVLVEVDKVYLRALVDTLLRLLLPSEDYTAETERTIIKDIIVNVIFGSVFDKVAQPWFLHQLIAKVLEGKELEAEQKKSQIIDGTKSKQATKSHSSLLNSTISTITSIPPFLRAISVTVSTIYCTITSSPVPNHYKNEPPTTTPLINLSLSLLPPSTAVKQSIHYMQIFLGIFSTFFTSLIYYVFNAKILNAKLVQTVLEVATKSLFPNGHPPPKEDDPTEEERKVLKSRCEAVVARSLPREFINVFA